MAGKSKHSSETSAFEGLRGARILIIEARYYEKIADELLAGAEAELRAAGVSFEHVTVPGALEIPLALSQAVKSNLIGSDEANARFDGAIALGCVIRGETSHYDTVCDNANHWLMQVAVEHGIPIGNAILTVENEAQAIERAKGGRAGKGADAVRACLTLVALERTFAEDEV